MTGYLRTIQFWLLLLACVYFSLHPSPGPVLEKFSDKLLHGAAYLALLISCDFAYRTGKHFPAKIAILLSYSLILEGLQHLVPNRFFSLGDLAANLAGLLVGLLFLVSSRKFFRKSA